MVNFVTLPREVWDEILECVIFTRTPVPKTLADLEAQVRVPVKSDRGYFDAEDPIKDLPDAHSLLLVNQQIHHEVKELISLRGNTYELDVKFVYESFLVPTWTSVPLAQEVIPIVKVTFQCLEKFRQGGSFRGEPLDVPRNLLFNETPPYVMRLHWLYRNLLWWYPHRHEEIGGAEKKALAFKVLEIDFIDPEDKELLAPENHSPEDHICFRPELFGSPVHEEGLVRPEWLAAGFTEHIPKFLLRGIYIATIGQMHYDVPFLSRVGEIVVKANGRVVGNLDIGQILADIKFVLACAIKEPAEYWIDHFILWKDTAIQRRRDRGFKDTELPSDWKERLRFARGYQSERKSTHKWTVSAPAKANSLDFI